MRRLTEFERLLLRSTINDATGCWEYPNPTKEGYGRVRHNGELVFAHRLAAHLYLGLNLTDLKTEVCHICDNRKCFNPQHLFLGTHKENMDDAHENYRAAKPKIRKEILEKIKFMLTDGRTYRNVAKACGVSLRYVGKIALRNGLNPDKPIKKKRILIYPRITEEKKRQARDMIKNGTTYREVAKILNISLGTVSNIVKSIS